MGMVSIGCEDRLEEPVIHLFHDGFAGAQGLNVLSGNRETQDPQVGAALSLLDIVEVEFEVVDLLPLKLGLIGEMGHLVVLGFKLGSQGFNEL